MAQFLERTKKSEIPTFGTRLHYSFYEKWTKGGDFAVNPFLGMPTYKMSKKSGTDHSHMEAYPTAYSRKLVSGVATESLTTRNVTGEGSPLLECKRTPWTIRSDANKTWPRLHSQRIVQVTDSLAEFLTSEKAVKYLNENKLTVTVHIPTDDGSLLSIPHPPFWYHNRDLPLMPGDYFPLLYV